MKKNKVAVKILMVIFLFISLFCITIKADATTIKETTKIGTNLDTIKEDSYIIGITKFNNVTMTGDRIVTATYNDSIFNWGKQGYKKPVIYFYVGYDIWYAFDENNTPVRVTDVEIKSRLNNPDIYYINNIEKMVEVKYPIGENIKVTTDNKEKESLVKIPNKDTILVPATVGEIVITNNDGEKLDSYKRENGEFKKNNQQLITTKVEGNTSNWTQNKTLVVTTNSDKNVALEYSFDNGTNWQKENVKLIIENGIYEVLVKDKVGNISEPNKVIVEKIDNKAPLNIELSSNGDMEYTKTKSIELTLEDIGGSGLAGGSISYGWSVSNEIEPSYNSVNNWNNAMGIPAPNKRKMLIENSNLNGEYYLWVNPYSYQDEVGNKNTKKIVSTGTFKFDNRAPIVTKIEGNINEWTQNKTLIVFAKDIESGIKEYSFDGGLTWQASNSKILTSNGTYNIKVKDKAGNISDVNTQEVTKIDAIKPTASVKVTGTTTKSITVEASCSASSGISKYEFSKDNGTTYTSNGTNKTYTFNNLTTETYNIKVRCTSTVGLNNVGSVSGTTNSLDTVTFNVPTGWAKSKNVTINYPEGYVYRYRVTNGTAKLGNTDLIVNTWYETTNKSEVITFTSNGTIVAEINDGINKKEITSQSITGIDNEPPTIITDEYSTTYNSIEIPYTIKKGESEIISYTCKYGITEGTYSENANKVTTSECKISGLESGKTYYYQICATSESGANSCVTGNVSTSLLINIQDIMQNGQNIDETIKDAINECDGVHECTLFFPDGIYEISESININKSNIKLLGNKETVIKFNNYSANSKHIAVILAHTSLAKNDLNNITIENLIIDVGATEYEYGTDKTYGRGISFYKAKDKNDNYYEMKDIKVKNCIVKNAYSYGIVFYGEQYLKDDYTVEIANNEKNQENYDWDLRKYYTFNDIENIEISGCTVNNSIVGIRVNRVDNVQVINNIVSNSTYENITLQGQNIICKKNTVKGHHAGCGSICFDRTENVKILENSIDETQNNANELYKIGICHNSQAGPSYNSEVSNNYINGASRGIWIKDHRYPIFNSGGGSRAGAGFIIKDNKIESSSITDIRIDELYNKRFDTDENIGSSYLYNLYNNTINLEAYNGSNVGRNIKLEDNSNLILISNK